MAENKKDEKDRQTKAGMLDKAGSPAASERENAEPGEDNEGTPKMSKKEAEQQKRDRPPH